MRRAPFIGLLAAALLAATATAAVGGNSAQRHAAAKAMLTRCLRAAETLVVGQVTVNTPEVPQRNRQQQAVYARCDNTKMTNLAFCPFEGQEARAGS